MLVRWISQKSTSGSILHKLGSVLDSDQWSYGSFSQELEIRLAQLLDRKKFIVTSSGTAALMCILQALRIPSGSVIIVPAFGYIAASHCAAMLGIRIAVADTQQNLPVICPESVDRLMGPDVSAVIGINYFGTSVDWTHLEAASEGVWLIEDAAGSIGAKYRSKPCGSFGFASIISMHTSKGVAAGGEGGGIATDDSSFADECRIRCRHGIPSNQFYRSSYLGQNSLMTNIDAVICMENLKNMKKSIRLRKKIIEVLNQRMPKKLVASTVRLNSGDDIRNQNYQTFSLLSNNRDQILKFFRLNGIEARPCWPWLISEQPSLKNHISRVDGLLPNSSRQARSILNLPLHPEISLEQIDWMVKTSNLLDSKLPEFIGH